MRTFKLTIIHREYNHPAHHEEQLTFHCLSKRQLFLACVRHYGRCLGTYSDSHNWAFSRMEDDFITVTEVVVEEVCTTLG